jgi:hypothetical protein
MSRKRWLVLFVALAVVVSFAAYGLPYNKLSWLRRMVKKVPLMRLRQRAGSSVWW